MTALQRLRLTPGAATSPVEGRPTFWCGKRDGAHERASLQHETPELRKVVFDTVGVPEDVARCHEGKGDARR